MKAAMACMAPVDALEQGEVMFPKHAMKERPPMFPLCKWVKVDLVSKDWKEWGRNTYWIQELPENMFRVHAVCENEAINERPGTVNPVLILRPTEIKSEGKVDLDVFADVQEHLKDESPEQDQEQFVLRLERGSLSPTDSNSSMPELGMRAQRAIWESVRIVLIANMSPRWNARFKGFRK
jgi:hypothetical protein